MLKCRPLKKDLIQLYRAMISRQKESEQVTNYQDTEKKAYLCDGTSCILSGTQELLRQQMERYIDAADIGSRCCLGRCHENAAFQYKGVNYSALSREELKDVFEGVEVKSTDDYHVEALGEAVLIGTPMDIQEFRTAIRQMLSRHPEQWLEEIKQSGLRDRGSESVFFWEKLKRCRQADGEVKFMICNADESTPGAFSERYLLEHQSFQVLLGMAITAYITGAHNSILYIREEYPESVAAMETAIKALKAEELIGEGILNFDLDIQILKARGAFMCYEDTTLISNLEGRLPKAKPSSAMVEEHGLLGLPTLISRVETLACLEYILMKGGQAFASIGMPAFTGTKLVSMDSAFSRPGVYELPYGTSLKVLVEKMGEGFIKPVKALQIGGPAGGLVPIAKISDLILDADAFEAAGFKLGPACLVGIPDDFPIIDYLEHLLTFFSHETEDISKAAREKAAKGVEWLLRAKNQRMKIEREAFEELMELLVQETQCRPAREIVLPIRNALQYFEEELKAYFS